MKNNIKKILFLSIVISAFFMLSSTSVFASVISLSQNNEIALALTGSTITGKTIKLNSDVNLGSDTLEINGESVDIILDLNGYKITSSAEITMKVSSGKLTIKDSKNIGLIENTASVGDALRITGGNVIINNVRISGRGTAIAINEIANVTNVTINGGEFTSPLSSAVSFEHSDTISAKLTINDGTFTGTAPALFFSENAIPDITVKGGKFKTNSTFEGMGAIIILTSTGDTSKLNSIIAEGSKYSKVNFTSASSYISTDKEIEVLKSHLIISSNTNTVTVTADKQNAFTGDKVTLTLGNIPSGYKFKKLSVKKAVFSADAIVIGDESDIENAYVAQGTLTYEDVAVAADNSFTMPDSIVLIKVELEKIPSKTEAKTEKDETPKTGMNFLDYIISAVKF